MKQNLTELVFILDKSGSMSGLESDTIGGYNSLLEKQKKEEGEAIVSTVLFSDEIYTIHERLPIKDIKQLTEKEYYVGGRTALLDAIGTSILKISKIHDAMKEEEKPARTLFIITTDGMENSSREFSYTKVKELIEKEKEKGSEFIFLGANIDAIKEAARFGIESDNAVNYKNDPKGVELNFVALDCAIKSYRKQGSIKKDWKEEINKDFKDRKNS